mgnify:CR=1 FL=1
MILVIFLIPIILAAAAIVHLNTVPVKDAVLYVGDGDVRVDQGEGYGPAEDGMTLASSDKVKTGASSEASLVLHDSVVLDIHEGSEVWIEDLSQENPRIRQESGSSWVKFLGIMDVDTFSVSTPTSMATARGTAFEVNMDSIKVAEGTVEVVVDGHTFTVEIFEKVELVDGSYVKTEMKDDEKEQLVVKMEDNLETLKRVRDEKIRLEYSRFQALFDEALAEEDLTFEEAMSQIGKLDRGEVSLEEVLSRSPVESRRIDHIAELTREIQEYHELIDQN